MLFFIKILTTISLFLSLSFFFTKKSLFYTLLHSELLIITIISLIWTISSVFNSLIGLGLGLCLLILGSLEIALCLLLLLL